MAFAIKAERHSNTAQQCGDIDDNDVPSENQLVQAVAAAHEAPVQPVLGGAEDDQAGGSSADD